eukprot:292871_1
MKMKTVRRGLPAAMITEHRLICCGGRPDDYLEYVDLYDFEENSWTQLSKMVKPRFRSGICTEKIKRKRVYVGGGRAANKSVEFYDIAKNEWFLLPETNKEHSLRPMLWTENVNLVNIASYG